MKKRKAKAHGHSTPEGSLRSMKHKFKPEEKRGKHDPATVPLSLVPRHPPCQPQRRRRSFLLPLPPSLLPLPLCLLPLSPLEPRRCNTQYGPSLEAMVPKVDRLAKAGLRATRTRRGFANRWFTKGG